MASPDRLKESPVSPDRVEEDHHNQSLSLTEPTTSPDRVKKPHVSPDRVEEMRHKLATALIGSKSVDAYLEEMRQLREDLGSDLGSIVGHDEFVKSVIEGLGSGYVCVKDEVLFYDPDPSFEKIRRHVLRRQSILQGVPDERPIYTCTDCGEDWHVDVNFDVIRCRACHCMTLLKKRRRAIVEYQAR